MAEELAEEVEEEGCFYVKTTLYSFEACIFLNGILGKFRKY